MFGRIRIVTRKVDATVTVPKEAVRNANGETTVVVVDRESKTDVRKVKAGATDGRLIEITEGVEPGESVVTLSYQALRTGQQVEIPKK
jgi:multidrug efflux pump subunit AcrA (membrane-fusion protein)